MKFGRCQVVNLHEFYLFSLDFKFGDGAQLIFGSSTADIDKNEVYKAALKLLWNSNFC